MMEIESVYLNEHSQEVYLISKDKYLVVVELGEEGEYIVKRELDLSSDIETTEVILDSTFLLELEGLLITCQSGEMYRVSSNDDILNVGSIESGVVAVGWSRNQE